MTKITVHADCNAAPKKQLLRDLNIAFANADVVSTLAFFTEDIHWRIIGDDDMRGKAAVREALEAMQGMTTRQLVIYSIITQGGEGVVNGEIIVENGGRFAFCDVCRFDSLAGKRIQSMMSYSIEIKSED